jgi:ribonucleoside-diphosphate reductase alpha chain
MTELSRNLLEKHYCRPGETVTDAYKRACDCFGTDQDHSNRLLRYLENGWFMFSSPVLSNAIKKGEKAKGLPISCFLTYVPDSIKGLCDHTTELRWLSVKGGGVGGHWSDVRAISDVTPGVNGFLHTVDADMVAYRQGKTRRGSYASYLNIDHPEVVEFLKMRIPTGDLNRKNLNLHHGINITDDFIDAVDKNLNWCLVDPDSCEVTETLKARDLWEEILTTRFRTGEPYLNYIDEANDKMHPALKSAGLRINGSNLCNEIHLPTSEDRTAVCCLSSVNLASYEEWKGNESFVGDLIEMLDNVLQFFIDNAPTELDNARYSAEAERSLGL